MATKQSASLMDKLDKFMAANREAILQDMVDVLKFETVSGGETLAEQKLFANETDAFLTWLAARAKTAGFAYRDHERQVAVVQYSDLEKFVALPVHSDVVPTGEGWTHPPFAGHIDELGVIWGRGTLDDKGPLVQMFWAMCFLATLPPDELTHGARLVVGTWEEGGPWDDIRLYLKKEPEAALCVISDAEFPIINAEKGMLTSAVVAEIPATAGYALLNTKAHFLSAHAGNRPNVVPDFAEAELAGVSAAETEKLQAALEHYAELTTGCRAELATPEPGKVVLRFFGKRAHASLPNQGHNAIVDLLGFLSLCPLLTAPQREVARAFSHAGADTTACWLCLSAAHPFVGATTVNLGVLNWENGTARAVFNIRPTLGQDPAEMNKIIEARFQPLSRRFGLNMRLEPMKASKAFYLSPDQFGDYLTAMASAYEEVTGRKAEYRAIGGTTYAKAFPNAVGFGPLDPATDGEELAHQVDERITVDQLMRNVRIYALMLAKICQNS